MIIGLEHFKYLQIQRGEVSDHRANFSKWKAAYEASLGAILDSIEPALPARCRALCDIGSGLGGIDILLAQRYGADMAIGLVDGFADKPEVVSHAQTFNDMEVALDFHRKNGAKNTFGIRPEEDWRGDFDLIVSFAAFAFHIPPTTYLDQIMACSHKGTVVIFDVRRSKKMWLEQLAEKLGVPQVLAKGEKFVRCAWNV